MIAMPDKKFFVDKKRYFLFAKKYIAWHAIRPWLPHLFWGKNKLHLQDGCGARCVGGPIDPEIMNIRADQVCKNCASSYLKMYCHNADVDLVFGRKKSKPVIEGTKWGTYPVRGGR